MSMTKETDVNKAFRVHIEVSMSSLLIEFDLKRTKNRNIQAATVTSDALKSFDNMMDSISVDLKKAWRMF